MYVFTKWDAKVGELYDLATEEFVKRAEVDYLMWPVKTYRAASCERCGTRFFLSNEEYDKYRWC